jgi:hypothetical protein
VPAGAPDALKSAGMGSVSTGGRNGFTTLPSPSATPTARRAFVSALAGAGLLACIAGYWWWSSAGEGREIRALPAEQRQGLYRRTLENLKTICDPAPGRSMREFCRSQATLALQFPECDDDCRRTARRHLSLPRR